MENKQEKEKNVFKGPIIYTVVTENGEMLTLNGEEYQKYKKSIYDKMKNRKRRI